MKVRSRYVHASMCAILGSLVCASVVAAPFVTPSMMKRNGLTDEQYAYLWGIGRSPKVDQQTMRDWYFKSHRYPNVTNWLDICGTSNNFAKLSYKLQNDNFELDDTNKILKAENTVLVSSNVVLEVNNEILTEENYGLTMTNGILVATNAVLEVDAKKAWKVENAAEKAKKKDQKNFEKWVEDTEKAKRKSSDEMAEFYDSILELAHAYEEAR